MPKLFFFETSSTVEFFHLFLIEASAEMAEKMFFFLNWFLQKNWNVLENWRGLNWLLESFHSDAFLTLQNRFT